jgi:hypothetical protein
MKQLYFRCNSGHYFAGPTCPFDGWTRPEFREVLSVVDQLRATARELSIGELKKAGISKGALERVVVIEFGDDHAWFEAVVPEGYRVDGAYRELRDLDARFK